MSKLAVIAVGGNSLIKDKSHLTVEDQYDCIVDTAHHIVRLIEKGINVVITHGNGPQVGFILLRSEISKNQIHEIPVPSAVADTQGALGYQIQQAIQNILREKNIKKNIVTVVTQVLVDKNDPAFQNPSKPIGPFLTEEDAEMKRDKFGWDVVEDAGRGWRRVVPSPFPIEIVELESIKNLIENDFLVVAVGGGGIPVIRKENGYLDGVPAVIDKDRASALLAENLNADYLIISTAVEQVCLNFGKENEKALSKLTLKEAEEFIAEGHFAKGSMLPKIEAAIQFLENGGKEVIITTPEKLADAVDGNAGTRIIG
ncbi:MAG: carbamate kinase [Candidatus Cloacimonetes bacterium]|nr:carbamate kinase [Candidatus Cloacimonadota bacterium]MCF7868164.1 carbamate kinase [Candidatus Cloacimonadota bacterium]MCF7884484.1 carbamate kinase [Candidatus Cloacimonadota bacterium]